MREDYGFSFGFQHKLAELREKISALMSENRKLKAEIKRLRKEKANVD